MAEIMRGYSFGVYDTYNCAQSLNRKIHEFFQDYQHMPKKVIVRQQHINDKVYLVAKKYGITVEVGKVQGKHYLLGPIILRRSPKLKVKKSPIRSI